MTPSPGRTLLANVVNDVMIDAAPPAYARAMAAVTPRKLWLASPGDCVVALAPCAPHFRDYVARTLGLDVGQVDVVAPDTIRGVHALDVVAELGATARVTASPVLAPFVADARTTRFARATGMRLEPYDTVPNDVTLAAVRRANTKHGFRQIAAGLGLPVADGGHADGPRALVAALTDFLVGHRAAIVKVDRSSNGHGTFIVRADRDGTPEQQVQRQVAAHGAPRCGWTYEEFLPFTSMPSVEMSVGEHGVAEFYSCEQRSVDNAWKGMSTPAASGPLLGTLTEATRRIGRWLHARGYRGIFDVDCGVFDGGYVVTEANVRRTGGTYLEELARRLRPSPAPGHRPAHWRADVRHGIRRLDFAAAVAALERTGLADPAADARVVLPVDTLRTDGKWRYFVLGTDARSVADAERELAGLLELV
ncbi:hypothetical protein QFZ75_008076 [Streptomyces sp. V3I8]|uniref:preATP grasp domain-containing protein n=1 Tax=Streptomyces sp. V3I8 TaxID=3042279 RepID=UPI002781FB88|nr:peptide ligase PGM1-related protein [Streptomyces sp. V3I8]MDQ1041574.1 hypothetical protein [Streptomyces sp. V3I8]